MTLSIIRLKLRGIHGLHASLTVSRTFVCSVLLSKNGIKTIKARCWINRLWLFFYTLTSLTFQLWSCYFIYYKWKVKGKRVWPFDGACRSFPARFMREVLTRHKHRYWTVVALVTYHGPNPHEVDFIGFFLWICPRKTGHLEVSLRAAL